MSAFHQRQTFAPRTGRVGKDEELLRRQQDRASQLHLLAHIKDFPNQPKEN